MLYMHIYSWSNTVCAVTGDVSKAPRPVSAGTLSSNEDVDDQDGNVTSFEQSKSLTLSLIITFNFWEYVYNGRCGGVLCV